MLITLRVSWIWPSLEIGRRWLTPSYAEPWLPLWAVIGLMVGGLVTARLALAVSQRLDVARAMAAVAGLLAVAVVIWGQYAASYGLLELAWLPMVGNQMVGWLGELPAPLPASIIAVLIWLRGLLDGSRSLPHERVWSTFISGFLVFCGVLLAGYFDPAGIPTGTEEWLLLMFGAGMGALALASLEMAHYGRKPQEGARLRIDRYWLGSVASVVVALLGAGLLIGALVSPEMVARVLSWVGILLQYVGVVLGYIFFVLAYIVFRMLTPLIEWLQARMATAEWMQNTQEMQERPELLPEGDPGSIIALAPQYEVLLRWLGGIGLVVLVALVFAMALRRLRPEEDDFVEEVRDSVFSRDLLAEQLGRFRCSLWPGRPNTEETWPYLSLDDEPSTRRAVRAMYQRLLAAARTAGLPRQPMQTPDEYAPIVDRTLDELELLGPARTAVGRLTSLYDAVRYGDVEPDADEVAATEDTLATVEAHLLNHGQRDSGQK